MKLLLTGITGLVGASVVTETLRHRDDIEITAICREAKGVTAQERVERFITEQCVFDGTPGFEKEVLKKITVIAGDILDLPVDEIVAKGPYDAMFHCAADVNLGKDPDGKVYRTNMKGTENILSLAKLLKVKALHYVGTAYVAGKCTGVVMENELPAKEFNNSYEKSKFEAEKLVRECGIPYTIYRPSIIVGRLSDGLIRKPLAFYRIMEFLGKIKTHHCAKNKLAANGPLDMRIRFCSPMSDKIYFVPIDYVQKAISRIFSLPVENKSYHITGESPVSTMNIAIALSTILQLPNLTVTDQAHELNANEKLITKMIEDLLPYFESQIVFDNSVVRATLGDEILDWKLDLDFLKKMVYSYYKETMPSIVEGVKFD